MAENQSYIRIEGSVAATVYSNPENGYSVLRLDSGGDEPVTVVGCIPDIIPGEYLILEGAWTMHPSYGQQFKAERAERRLPTTGGAVYDFLVSGAVRGVGPATAAEIIKKFGAEALDILENQPEKLAEIRGISQKKALEIGADFHRRSFLRRLMEFLAENGIRPRIAIRLFKAYGEDAMDAVRENPYILVHEYFGADFFEADGLAINLGFEADSAERLEAALLFELKHNLSNGHTFLPRAKLLAAAMQLTGTDDAPAEEALDMLTETGQIIGEDIAGQNACYLEGLHESEVYVASRIRGMAIAGTGDSYDISRFISSIEEAQGIVYDEKQYEAVRLAAENRILILTGGPGTGKTTSVRGILALFDRLGLDTALTAPTGRAAKRMSELTGRPAQTVHRLLGAGYESGSDELIFERCEDDPLKEDAVILDEASMVDLPLMYSLLRAMKSDCRLVLVGDADQLPSVGPGSVFYDIIRSGAAPTVKLDRIFRQAEESLIVKNAHLINRGILPNLGEKRGDFFFLQRNTPEAAVDTIVELCASRLPKNMGIDPSQIQILSPSRKNTAGTINLNRRIQEAVNPPSPDKKEKSFGDFVFREGDRIMQIRNNYDIIWKNVDGMSSGTGIYNGDVGRIGTIDLARETMSVEYEDRFVIYPFELLGELEPAFAMTVHKSQGSEYKAVILSVSAEAPFLLTRSVLYTAVTRAKELLIIVGEADTVSRMTMDDRKQRRYCGLKTRLTGSI